METSSYKSNWKTQDQMAGCCDERYKSMKIRPWTQLAKDRKKLSEIFEMSKIHPGF